MKNTILIIAAMEDIELNYLKTNLKNIREVQYKSFKFFEGEMLDKKIVLLESKVGLINAAISLTLAIEKYNPNIIINEGIARLIYKKYT